MHLHRFNLAVQTHHVAPGAQRQPVEVDCRAAHATVAAMRLAERSLSSTITMAAARMRLGSVQGLSGVIATRKASGATGHTRSRHRRPPIQASSTPS